MDYNNLTAPQLAKLGIECWADNDGGLWFFHPETGQTITIY